MNRPGGGKSASITLCIFPHLQDFVVIDARKGLSGRPAIVSLRIREVLGEQFYSTVIDEFSELLKRPDKPFLRLMGIPQEVEGLIRTSSLKAIMERLNSDLTEEQPEPTGSISVLFFTGALLGMDSQQLGRAGQELFGDQLNDEMMGEVIEKLSALVREERASEVSSSQADLRGLITGESRAFVTLWEQEQDG